MGRRREQGREGKLGEGLRWLTVHADCLTYREIIPSLKWQKTVHCLHAILCVAISEVRRIERRMFKSKSINKHGHHNCWNQSLQFQASFSPHVIDSERTQHYWIRAGERGGLTHKHPHPLSLALTLICVRQVHHPVLSQVPVNVCQYTGLARRQGLEGESIRG